jgi:organic radical activating enzyme
MNSWTKERLEYKKEMDKISPSFCTAKWSQVTIHLGVGHTHSCHHPRTHVIPIEEIKENPSALHNTGYKKLLRKQMLDGSRPSECDYCWKAEDSGHTLSDRILKSYEPWSKDRLKEYLAAGSDGNVNPSYLEISFSNVCNFKCSYCSPDVSSKWMEEIKEFGPYPTSMRFNNLEWVQIQNKMPHPEREYNPYVEAFWQWWPELYPTLHTFRITGGEPLLSKHTFRVLDHILENPNKNLELNINSNFCVPDDLFDKFIEKLKKIQISKSVKSILVYTSCEAHGKQAEYIRFGLDYAKWLSNCEKYLTEVPRAKIGIMSTYNALSVTSYTEFLKDILYLNEKYGKPKWYERVLNKVFNIDIGTHPVNLDIPYLNNPPHQTVGILTKDIMSMIKEQIAFMKANTVSKGDNSVGFYKSEIQKLERLYSIFSSRMDGLQDRNRKDFVAFVDEHDKRRGTNFLETFPELAEFYFYCKKLNPV